ncbi:MAG: hypothetical protein ACK5N8_06760 [Alphaproteobacteria bacterium]
MSKVNKKAKVNRSNIKSNTKVSKIGSLADNNRFKWALRSDIVDWDWRHNDFSFGDKIKDLLIFYNKIKPTLDSYAQMTWDEVNLRKHCHSWDITYLHSDLIKRFKDRFRSEECSETLYQININQKHRIIGFKEGEVFYIMWNDPNHKAYITQKKNT